MLGLQGALLVEHELDHVLGEVLVALQRLGASEVLGDEEVDVAVLCVAEDDGVCVVVLVEEHLQVGAHLAERLHGDGDVLQQRRGALRPVPCDLGVEALAHHPHLVAALGVLGHLGAGLKAAEVGEGGVAGGDPLGDPLVVVGLVLDQQRRLVGRLEASGEHVAGVLAHRADGRGVDQFDDIGPGVDQVRQRGGRGVEGLEQQQPGRRAGRHLDGAEDRLGDEAERPLGADHQVLEDLDGTVVVEERVEAVAHGVLDRVAAPEVGRDVRAAQFVADPLEHLDKGRLAAAQFVVCVDGARVDHGARRQHHRHRLDGAVGVLLGAAGHAGGVVGDHAADGACDLGGRVGPELALVGRKRAVDLTDGGARLHADPLAAVEDLDVAEVAAHVDGQPHRQRLPGQARSARAERQRPADLAGDRHGGGDIGGVPGPHDRVGGVDVVRRVDRKRDPVEFARADGVGAERGPQGLHARLVGGVEVSPRGGDRHWFCAPFTAVVIWSDQSSLHRRLPLRGCGRLCASRHTVGR